MIHIECLCPCFQRLLLVFHLITNILVGMPFSWNQILNQISAVMEEVRFRMSLGDYLCDTDTNDTSDEDSRQGHII